MSNDSGLLCSREERVMAKLKEEIDGDVHVSIRLYVMSSAELPSILHSDCLLQLSLTGAYHLQQVGIQ